MKNITALFLLCFIGCLPCLLMGQATFSKRYFADAVPPSSTLTIDETPAGNFVAGDVSVQKCHFKYLDENGDPLWGKSYIPFPAFSDSLQALYVNEIIALPDNGIVASGISLVYHLDEVRCFLIRLDAQGNKVWDISLGNVRQGSALEESIIKTQDGGFVIVFISPQEAFPDVVLTKVNDQGQIEWSKRYDSGGADYTATIIETTGGDLVFATDKYLCKTDESGNLLWSKQYEGQFYLTQSFSNGDILGHYNAVDSQIGNTVRLDPAGNVLWAKKHINTGASYYWYQSPSIVTSDDKIITSVSPSTFAKLDGNGNIEWSRNYSNGIYSNYKKATADGGFVLLGTSYYPGNFNSVIKADADGVVDGCTTFPACFQLQDNSLQLMGIISQFTVTDYAIDTTLEGIMLPLSYTAEEYCTPGELPQPEFTAPDTLCVGDCFTPGNLQQMFANGGLWEFEGCSPDVSSEQAPANICTLSPGTFKLTQTIFYGGCVDSFSTYLTVVAPPTIALGADTLLCEGQAYTMDASSAVPSSFLWDDGTTTPTRTVTSSGTYHVTTSGSYCEASDTLTVRFFEQLFPSSLDLGPDAVICLGTSLLLHDSLPGIDDYTWDDGTTGPTKLVTAAGNYQLTAHYEGCSLEDAISVSVRNCEGRLYVPTVFTPNGDGFNDVFELFSLDIQLDEMKVFDRWGSLVFDAKLPFAAWDGTIEGKPANEGTYVYWLRTADVLSGEKNLVAGEVQLLR